MPLQTFLSDIPTINKRGDGHIQCDKCESKFRSNDSKSRHIKTVHEERDELLECILCSKKLANSKCLAIHEQNCFSKGGVKKIYQYIQCTFCDYKIPRTNVGTMKKHVRFYHDKIYDNVCDLCGYKAFTNNILKQHTLLVHVKKNGIVKYVENNSQVLVPSKRMIRLFTIYMNCFVICVIMQLATKPG